MEYLKIFSRFFTYQTTATMYSIIIQTIGNINKMSVDILLYSILDES